MTSPKWRRFEELVHKVQSDLAPLATVTLDERVPGMQSGVERQIDIAVRAQVGQFPIFVAIDCKDHADPLDVKSIEEFIGLVQDVGANKGVLVAANGFTPAALTRGQKACLDLLMLVDTGDHDWRATASIPVLVHMKYLRSYSLRFQGTGRIILPGSDPNATELFGPEYAPLGLTRDVLARFWEEWEVPEEGNLHSGVAFAGPEVYVTHGGEFFRVEVTATLKIDHLIYFHDLPLAEVSGFKNEADGTVSTRGFTTSDMNIEDIMTNWHEVGSLDDLAARPVLTFWMRNCG